MESKELVSDLYKEDLEKSKGSQKFRDGLALVCILLDSVLVAVSLSTFVEQGELVPEESSGLAKLIQRVGLLYFDVRTPSTLLNVLFNAVPTMFAYRIMEKGFTTLSCVSLLTVSVLVDQLPVAPVAGDILLIAVFEGILNGLGMSLILDNRVNSGGTGFIAMCLFTKYKIFTFNYMLGFGAVIILIPDALLGMGKALYSIISQFCGTRVINVLYKKYRKKTLLIMTDSPAAVSADPLEITNRNSTTTKSFGSYSANEKYTLYTVLSDGDVKKMKKRIREAYPDTFVNVLNSGDVVGNLYIQPLEQATSIP